MIWTAARLDILRVRSRDSIEHAWRECGDDVPIGKKLRATWMVVGFLVITAVSANLWDSARRIMGAPALRPMHDLLLEVVGTLGDPEVEVLPGGKGRN